MRARLESLLFVLVLLGCTKSNPQLVPIDGQVTMDGAPLADHVVTFTPVGDTKGSGALGSTDDNGRFSLTDVRGQAGAHVGQYKVSLYPMGSTGASADDPASVVAMGHVGLPPVYIDPNRTPLRAVVPRSGGSVEVLLTATGQGASTKTTPASNEVN